MPQLPRPRLFFQEILNRKIQRQSGKGIDSTPQQTLEWARLKQLLPCLTCLACPAYLVYLLNPALVLISTIESFFVHDQGLCLHQRPEGRKEGNRLVWYDSEHVRTTSASCLHIPRLLLWLQCQKVRLA